jgi:hypothetical protein
MAITTAVQRGPFVYVYDERGIQTAVISCGSGARDGLVGYTGWAVSIRRGEFVYIYDSQGRQTGVVPARAN